LYTGNGTAGHQINNGIDLAGEGGLVWLKRRDDASNNSLYDSIRGNNPIWSNRDNAELVTTNGITSFNSNGFTLGSGYADSNHNGGDLCSWTFRKQKGFFDVVTWNGDGSATGQTISHALGSTPGFIAVKELAGTAWWACWHRSLGAARIFLNENNAATTANIQLYFGDGTNYVAPTASSFTVNSNDLNESGNTYVAYIFAHDDAQFGTDEDESIIKCGGYTGTGSAGNFINLGFEPQWVMIKRTNDAGHWMMFDIMRGIPTGGEDSFLLANTSDAEVGPGDSYASDYLSVNSTGFTLESNAGDTNGSNKTFIYMAIRRPNKPPEISTDVFAMNYATESTGNRFTTGFPVDLTLTYKPNNGVIGLFQDRLRGYPASSSTAGNYPILFSSSTNQESAYNNFSPYLFGADSNTSLGIGSNLSGNISLIHAFKRAPGFMDVVAYTGTGSARTLNHNLTVVPEMMIVKKRSSAASWQVYHSSQGNTKYSPSFRTDPFYTSSDRWNSTTPTSTQFSVGTDSDINQSTSTYIVYLFATLPGISKVGSYSGTGNAINVDCGFTNGARFILIKRTDTEIQGTGGTNWYVWDTARGIVSGNDPYLILNSTAAQVTNTDYVDPLSTGFTVTASGATGLNVSGGTYIFLAIA
jgi:hypothetical protein